MKRQGIKVKKSDLYEALKKDDFHFMDDEQYLRLQYLLSMNDELNLNPPQTFNEKLQWLKLHDRKPLYTQLVDKYKNRKYVAQKIGDAYLVDLLGVYDSYEAIDFDNLPDQFVLKANHASGGVYICRDKSQIDHKALKQDVDRWLGKNYYWLHREWPYKNVEPKIIIEEYIADESETGLKDYKFFCFNGEPKFMYIASSRDVDTKFDFYDLDFNHLDFKQQHDNSTIPLEKPKGFEKMIELSRKLAENIPHVRVDLYDIDGDIYFGEMTFFHNSGNVPFEPEEWDQKIGDLLELPHK